MQLEKVYEPQRFEPRWAQWWVESGIYHAKTEPGRPTFSLSCVFITSKAATTSEATTT